MDRIPLRYSNAVTIDLAIDGSGRRYLVTYEGETGLVTVYRDAFGAFARVERTQAHAGRFLSKAVSESSGDLHVLLRYFRATHVGVVDQNRHGGRWQTQLVGYVGAFGRADIDVEGADASPLPSSEMGSSGATGTTGPEHRTASGSPIYEDRLEQRLRVDVTDHGGPGSSPSTPTGSSPRRIRW